MAGVSSTVPTDLSPYEDILVSVMRMTARRTLSKYLNLRAQLPGPNHMPDFTGVAEMIGYDYLEICAFERDRDPMGMLLDSWSSGGSLTCMKPTIANLFRVIHELGREDVLSDVWPVIENDIKVWQEKQKELRSFIPVQDETVSQSSRPETDHHVDQFKFMTQDDVRFGKPQYYDAFVCHSMDDIGFVKDMISNLESPKHNLRLCVPARDMLPGSSYHTISASLIEERCKKMVAVVSPAFLKSSECDFQIKFAHAVSPGSRSKKVIPVLKESCLLPSILRHITLCDYTKGDLKEWFWARLAQSIKMPVDNASTTQAMDKQKLSQIHFDSSGSKGSWSSDSSVSSGSAIHASSC